MFRIKLGREIILKLLYQIDILELADSDIQSLLEPEATLFKGLNQEEKDFIIKIIQHIMKEKKKIDKMITKNLIGWKLQRLTYVDRNLLRMGIGESYYNDQKAVIIDDIIRIAKKYSSQDSYKIINAILDKVIK